MNKSMLAGAALIAVAAVAVPVVGWSQSPPPPPAPGAAGPGGGPDHGPMRPGWGGRRWGMNRSPQQECVDRIARRAGFIAATGFKLNLTAEQKPLWDKIVAATQSAQDAQRQVCSSLPASADDRGKETLIDRMNQRQKMLQAQLQALQQTQPAVQALYDKLTPEQKAIVDHPFHRG